MRTENVKSRLICLQSLRTITEFRLIIFLGLPKTQSGIIEVCLWLCAVFVCADDRWLPLQDRDRRQYCDRRLYCRRGMACASCKTVILSETEAKPQCSRRISDAFATFCSMLNHDATPSRRDPSASALPPLRMTDEGSRNAYSYERQK